MKTAKTDDLLSIKSDEFVWSQSGLSEAHQHILPILRTWLRDADVRSLLDIGSGNGSVANELSQAGIEVTGIEISESGLAIARSAYPEICFVQGGVESPIPPEMVQKYDAVIAVEVLEHLFQPRLLFERAKEALRPGGVLILSTPYHGYLKNLALALFGKFDEHWHPLRDYGHIKFFSKKTLSTLFEEQGFHVGRFARVGRIPTFAKSMILEGLLG